LSAAKPNGADRTLASSSVIALGANAISATLRVSKTAARVRAMTLSITFRASTLAATLGFACGSTQPTEARSRTIASAQADLPGGIRICAAKRCLRRAWVKR
jgi:hypothetical protein